MSQSLEYYEKAAAIHPGHLSAVLGMAQTTEELEFAFADLFPDRKNRFNALPLYRRVVRLEPNGLGSNYAAAHYFYKKNMTDVLESQVKHCAKIFPSLSWIRNQGFYGPETREAVRQGFEQAVQEKIKPATAFFSMSSLAQADGAFTQAAEYYQKAIESQPGDPSSRNYLKMGRLFLISGERLQALDTFSRALSQSSAPLKTLNTIFYYFRNHKDLPGFLAFAATIPPVLITSEQIGIYTARAQMDLEQFETARQTLEEIIRENEDPEAFYLLAQLAKRKKDWDTMELRIQRATVLDPDNSRYFNMLADALIYQKKYKSAALYMEKAIYNDPGNHGYKNKLQKIQSRMQ